MIGSIIDDAQRAAENILTEARIEAVRETQEVMAEARIEAASESQEVLESSAEVLVSALDPLIERVESLRTDAAALVHEMESATSKLQELVRVGEERLEGASGEPPLDGDSDEAADADLPEPASPEGTAPFGPSPVAYPGRGADVAGGKPAGPEEVVLRATQMAVAGSSRSEIESTLRDEFGIDEPAPVVNEILGSP